MVRRGILLGYCAEQSKGPARHHRGGGGVPCRHAWVHDYGRALPEHPSGVAVPLGLLPGRAGPGPTLGGGGASLRPPGSGRGSPPPVPRARTARAAARRVRPCPSPCAPRASLLLGRHRRPCPPLSLRLCLGGGGRLTGPPRGGEGGGLAASLPAAGPRPRRGRPVLRVTHVHPRPRPAPGGGIGGGRGGGRGVGGGGRGGSRR